MERIHQKRMRNLRSLFLLRLLLLQSIVVVRATNTVVSPVPEDETKAENNNDINADYDLFVDDNDDAAAASTAATMPSLSKPRRWGESCSSTTNADGTSISGNKSNNTPTSASSASTTTNVPYQPSSSSSLQQQQQQPDTSSSSSSVQAGLPPILLFGVKNNNGNGNGNSKNQQQQYKPPEGYVLAGRVYTDDRTNRAVLDMPSDEERVLTYFDCGVTGSTTPTLEIQSAVIRHAISTTPLIRGRRRRRRRNEHTRKAKKNRPRQPTSKTTGGHDVENKGSDKVLDDEIEQVTDDADDGDENGAEEDDDEEEEEDGGYSYFSLGSPPTDQLLLIALSGMEVELDGDGGTLLLEPGQIVLFQETNPCQHTCRPIDDDMTMMLLTLPLTVDTNRILGIVRPSDGKQHEHGHPCPTDEAAAAAEAATTAVTRVPPRKYLLGGFGFTLSLLVADFLGKVAPLWLSVGVGGTCFVGGTTYAFVQSVDPLCETLHYWWKERRRRSSRRREEAEEQEQEEEEESNQEATTTTTSPQEPLLFLQHQFRDDVEYPVQQDEAT